MRSWRVPVRRICNSSLVDLHFVVFQAGQHHPQMVELFPFRCVDIVLVDAHLAQELPVVETSFLRFGGVGPLDEEVDRQWVECRVVVRERSVHLQRLNLGTHIVVGPDTRKKG